MKKTNNRWIDENNNSWDCGTTAKKEAKRKSKSLVGCFHCSDCENCSDCLRCVECLNCEDCMWCCNSVCCVECVWCVRCSDCWDCKGSVDLELYANREKTIRGEL